MKWKQESAQVLEGSKGAGASFDQQPAGGKSVPPARPAVYWWRNHRVARGIIIGIVVLLAAVRLCLPFAVERYVNKQLNHTKDYGGRIGSVHLQLWRGQYQINDLKIFKRNGEVHTPLFSSSLIFLSIEWKELFHGSVVGQIRLQQPHLNFVSGPTAAQSQSGANEDWNAVLESLFPFQLNRLEIIEGQVHFQNQYSTPPVDIYLNKLSATATNLSNSRSIPGALPAGVTAHATTIGGGDLDLSLQLNPTTKAPTYQLDAQLTNVNLTALNSFLRAYGKFDVAHGIFGLYTSVASKDGAYDGYIKVFFNKLDVFAWEKERTKNALQVFWDAIVGSATTVLKNQHTDTLATRVPISGSYTGSSVGVWTAISTLLRNAFIRALAPKVDQHETIQNVEQKTHKEQKIEPAPPPSKGGAGIAKPPG